MKLPRAATRGLRGAVLGGRYQVVRRIGKGGMGAVYELRHRDLGRRFALKTMWSDLAEHPEALGRFRREAEIIAKLRHPHIVEIVDWDVLDDGSPCMVMEYLDGETLAQRLKRDGRLAWHVLARISDQVLSALSLAHHADVVHRDLTPWNIFLAADDAGEIRAKLLDFGISKIRSARTLSTNDESVLGTPAYMSPEQAEGKHEIVGPATDVWAMGAILFKMATGKDAFSASSVPSTLYRICYGEPESLIEHRPDAPAAFVELVGRALSRDPDRRVTDADRLREGLRTALGDTAPSAFVEPLRAPPARIPLPLEPGPQTGDPAPAPDAAPATPHLDSESTAASHAARGPTSDEEMGEVRHAARYWLAGLGLLVIIGILAFAIARGSRSEESQREAATPAARMSPDASFPDAQPPPAVVTLVLRSSPRGAYVYREADGHLLGRTPYREKVEKGSSASVFRVTLKGHEDELVEMPTDADHTELVKLRRIRSSPKPHAKPKHRGTPEQERKKGEPLPPPL